MICQPRFFHHNLSVSVANDERGEPCHRVLPARLRAGPQREAAGLGGRSPYPLHRRDAPA